MMPETYTKEQIKADYEKVLAYIENGAALPSSKDDPYWGASAAIERLGKVLDILSDLSTAERERDTLEVRVAELEVRLQGAADRAVEWQKKLCKADDWSCENCTECADLRAAIVGKKEG